MNYGWKVLAFLILASVVALGVDAFFVVQPELTFDAAVGQMKSSDIAVQQWRIFNLAVDLGQILAILSVAVLALLFFAGDVVRSFRNSTKVTK